MTNAHIIVLNWMNTVKVNENKADREAQLEIYPQEVV